MACGSQIRIGKSQYAQNAPFTVFHEVCSCAGFVIITTQMQHAMHRQMRVMSSNRFLLFARFARDHRRAQNNVAAGFSPRFVREGKHIGGVVLAAVTAVERARLPSINDSYGDFGTRTKGRKRPAAQLSAGRNSLRAGSYLHAYILQACIRAR